MASGSNFNGSIPCGNVLTVPLFCDMWKVPNIGLIKMHSNKDTVLIRDSILFCTSQESICMFSSVLDNSKLSFKRSCWPPVFCPRVVQTDPYTGCHKRSRTKTQCNEGRKSQLAAVIRTSIDSAAFPVARIKVVDGGGRTCVSS